MDRTLVIVKPGAVKRGIIGRVIQRFEDKGLKIVAMKMRQLDDRILEEHYAHLKDKPFFPRLVRAMKSAPVVLMVIEGKDVVDVVRKMAGPTNGREALPGTIRGDFSMSIQNNVVHASDSKESAEKEIKRFFSDDEIHEYSKNEELIYAEDEI